MRIYLSFCLLFMSLSPMAQEKSYDVDIHHALVENKGQWPKGVLYQTKFSGGNLWVEEGRFLYQLIDNSAMEKLHASGHNGKTTQSENTVVKQTYVSVDFVGVNTSANKRQLGKSINYYSYFLGQDTTRWASAAHGYSQVIRDDYYAGIDFKIIQERERLKYEFLVQPNVDPSIIQMKYKGMKSLKIDRSGNLLIETSLGKILEEKPYVYQIVNGKFSTIRAKFKLEKNLVSFDLGPYDKSLELIIDPILVFATYSGAVSDNFGMTATYGYDGSAYTGGMVFGNNYPQPDPLAVDSSSITAVNSNSGITDVFVAKYNATGTQLLWSCFLGGGSNTTGTETVHSLICDSSNNVYFFGVTSSSDFPLVNPYQSSHQGGTSLNFTQNGTNFQGGTDFFLAKISENGHTLFGSTYFGGSKNDGVNYNESLVEGDSLHVNYGDQFRGEIMLGPNREVIVGSCTRSNNFPIKNAIQSSFAGKQDGVIFSFSNNLSSLNFSTYYGGSGKDACYALKLDSNNNILFAGGTNSTNLSGTAGRYQPDYGGGAADGFIGKLNPTGSTLMAATYLGYEGRDQIYLLHSDRNSKVFVTGIALTDSIPIVDADFYVTGSPMFIMKFNEDLTVLEKSTSFGKENSTLTISPTAFLVDRCGEIYVSGWGSRFNVPLSGYPVTPDAVQQTPHSVTDFYMIVIDRTFGTLIYGTYIGDANSSDHVDGGTSRFDQQGIVYQGICGGCGGSSTWPTTSGAYSNTNNSSNCNMVVYKFDFQVKTKSSFESSDTLVCAQSPIQLENNSSSSDEYFWDFGNGVTSTEFEPVVVYAVAGTYVIKLIVTDSVCKYNDTTELVINVGPPLDLVIPGPIYGCGPMDTVLVADSKGGASYFIWSSNRLFTDTLNASVSDSNFIATIGLGNTYYIKIGNAVCTRIDSVQLFNLPLSIQLANSVKVCDDSVKTLSAITLLPNINFTYQWMPLDIILGSNTGKSVNIQTDSSQYLYFTAQDSSGCVVSDSIFIAVKKSSDLDATAAANPILVPQGGKTELSVTPTGYQYIWIPGLGVAEPSKSKTSAKVFDNTTYYVTVTDGYCSRSASVLVNVYTFRCDENRVFLPNAFSPNGDGENDFLFVRSLVTEEFILKVFNRWGELMFQTSDHNVGWDGKYKGVQVDPDVYDYYLEAYCVDGQKFFKKGNITLIR